MLNMKVLRIYLRHVYNLFEMGSLKLSQEPYGLEPFF